MLRVVLDTNLFVSSLLVKSGYPAQAIDAWRQRRYLLVTSPSIISEIGRTLNYQRIRHKYRITDVDVAQMLALLERDALIVPGRTEVSGAIPDDPDDEAVLACAIDGQADLIASGDRHLLEMSSYRDIPIMTVRQFMAHLQATEGTK